MHRFTEVLLLLLLLFSSCSVGLLSSPDRQADAFVLPVRTCPTTFTNTKRPSDGSAASSLLRLGSQRPNDDPNDNENDEEPEIIQQISTIKIDDGGSDLTDRFKYKVQALMGNFDPPDASQDTEDTAGNILGAMLQFPTTYTFHAVGKHAAGDEAARQAFVQSVQTIVRQGAGLRNDDASMDCEVVPRSSKFVKVSVTVTVESGSMITEIYQALGALSDCVMQF
eukprot:scaffold19202_cov107-Amphora_coffeaeformis.AAC.1